MNKRLGFIKLKYSEARKAKEKYETMLNEVKNEVAALSIDDIKNLTYSEMKSLYDDVGYMSAFDKIRAEFCVIMNEKKEEIYPALKKAHYYPMLNSLDLSIDVIKAIDDRLYRNGYNTYIHVDSSLWRPYKNYLSKLEPLGILEKYYEFFYYDDEDEFGEERAIVSEKEVLLCQRYWDLSKKIKDANLSLDERKVMAEELEKLCEDGYSYLCIGSSDVESPEELAKFSSSIIYKVILAPDTTYEKV